MFYLYILESLKDKRWYIGITEDVQNRLAKHSGGSVRSTKAYRPYVLLYTESFETRTAARKREIAVKHSGAIRAELKLKLQSMPPSSSLV